MEYLFPGIYPEKKCHRNLKLETNAHIESISLFTRQNVDFSRNASIFLSPFVNELCISLFNSVSNIQRNVTGTTFASDPLNHLVARGSRCTHHRVWRKPCVPQISNPICRCTIHARVRYTFRKHFDGHCSLRMVILIVSVKIRGFDLRCLVERLHEII